MHQSIYCKGGLLTQCTFLARGVSSAHVRVQRALIAASRRSAQTNKDGTYMQTVSVRKQQGALRITVVLGAASQPEGSAADGANKPDPQPIPSPNSSTAPQTAEPSAPAAAPAAPAPAAAAAPSSPTPSAGEGDDFAKAWRPPPGEPPLWWVEKFEARRKAEARRKEEEPSFVTTLERVQGEDKEGSGGNPALRFLSAVAQVVQLVVVLALLLLLPAALHDGGLFLDRPFTTFAAYLAFFGLGTVARIVRYGKLAPRKSDRQVATWSGRLAFAGFVLVLPLLHWYAMYRFVGLALYTNVIPFSTTLYDVLGAVGMAAATALNVAASRELGAAYDRIAAPEALVTSGPYRWMQHPIYTSYILLFFSYGMWLHSATAALAMLVVCVLYYRSRTALEGRVLEEAFGSYYRDYASRTKKFIPFLV